MINARVGRTEEWNIGQYSVLQRSQLLCTKILLCVFNRLVLFFLPLQNKFKQTPKSAEAGKSCFFVVGRH